MTTLASIREEVRQLIGAGAYDRLFKNEWTDEGIQFACGQVASLLGLTRIDTVVTAADKKAIIPSDAVKIVDVSIGPVPRYTISVSPEVATASFGVGGGVQSPDPIVFIVTIHRISGHTAPINVSMRGMRGDGWAGSINGSDLSSVAVGESVLVTNVPDVFYINMSGDRASWVSAFDGLPSILFATDTNNLEVQSNVFTVQEAVL